MRLNYKNKLFCFLHMLNSIMKKKNFPSSFKFHLSIEWEYQTKFVISAWKLLKNWLTGFATTIRWNREIVLDFNENQAL